LKTSIDKLQKEASNVYFVEWPKKIYLVEMPQEYIDYFKKAVDINKDKILSDIELYEKVGLVLENGRKVHGMEYIQDFKRKLIGVNIKPNRRIIKSYKEIIKEMEELAKKYPDKVEIKVIGETYNKRKIVVMKISNNVNESNNEKASILITGLTHAREWATGAAALEVAKDILENPNSELVKYLNKIDVYVLPVLNPDGYEWSLKHDAWWRKNRTKRKDYGVDLSRNYYTSENPILYRLPEDNPKKIEDDKGASDNPADIQYRGPYGNSEKEVQAVTNFVKNNKIDVVIDLHSFGNIISLFYNMWIIRLL